MKIYYVNLECVWGDERDKDYVQKKYNICLMNITKLYRKHHPLGDYYGNETYIFMGEKEDLERYIREDYSPDDEAEEFIKEIKEMEV